MDPGDDTASAADAKRLYDSGKHREALELYLRLAKGGNVECQAFVGWMYAKGARGVEQDYQRAREWLSQAAQSGEADILYLLAVTDHHLHNYEEAIQSYRKAADLGYSAAYYQLGRMHRAGTGFDQNKDKAYELFDEAAKRGASFCAQGNRSNAYERVQRPSPDAKRFDVVFAEYNPGFPHGCKRP